MENKRGQDLSITTLLLIVLGVIVIVIIIMGFTVGWNFIFDKFRIVPGQNLQAIGKSCELAAQGDLQIDYCTYKKISLEGNTEYINCEDDRVEPEEKGDIGACPAVYTADSKCVSLYDSASAREKVKMCDGTSKIRVKGKSCQALLSAKCPRENNQDNGATDTDQ